MLLRRSLDLSAALKLGFRLSLDDVRADEFAAAVVLEEKRQSLEDEQMNRQDQR